MCLWRSCITRVGQNHIYTVYIRYFWQGNHQMYGYIRCIYTVLANPMHHTYPHPHVPQFRACDKFDCFVVAWEKQLHGVGLATTVYIRHIWPYIWSFFCQKYPINTFPTHVEEHDNSFAHRRFTIEDLVICWVCIHLICEELPHTFLCWVFLLSFCQFKVGSHPQLSLINVKDALILQPYVCP